MQLRRSEAQGISVSPNSIQPTTIVIFGASGDLTQRKLIPALFHLYRKGQISPD